MAGCAAGAAMPQSPDWARLTLPSDDREAWEATAGILQSCREALDGAAGLAAIDAAITAFASSPTGSRACAVFSQRMGTKDTRV